MRNQRLQELIREEVNGLFETELSDPRLAGAHVTQVDLSPDGSCARLWV